MAQLVKLKAKPFTEVKVDQILLTAFFSFTCWSLTESFKCLFIVILRQISNSELRYFSSNLEGSHFKYYLIEIYFTKISSFHLIDELWELVENVAMGMK